MDQQLGTLKVDIFRAYSLILIHGNPNFVLLVVVLLLLLAVDGNCQEAEGLLSLGQTGLKKMILVSFEATSASNSTE